MTAASVADIDTSTLELVERNGRRPGPLDVSVVVTADRDRSYPERRYTTALDVERPAVETDAYPVRVVTTLELPKGRYQSRVAASSGANAGGVIHDLEVTDFGRGRLSMGGVSVTAPPDAVLATFQGADATVASRQTKGCRPPLCPDDFLAARAAMTVWMSSPTAGGQSSRPGPATTRRAFSPDHTLLLFTEVYDNRTQRGTGRGDRAHDRLRDAVGTVVRVSRESRPATPDTDRHAFTVRLPLQDVEPGAYVLQLTAPSDDDERPVTRSVPISVTATE